MQTALSFPQNLNYSEENFLFLPENFEAQKILEKFFAQNSFTQSALQSLILKGEAACGKTHLLNIFAQKNSAQFLTKNEISAPNFLQIFRKNNFYIFENADEIADDELLLRLVNGAFEREAFLIISLKNFTNFKLRDLTSRLKNIFTLAIENPKEDSVKQLIANGLSRRQIKLSTQMIDFISSNVARNYAAIFTLLNNLENLCHHKKGEILLKDLKSLF